MGTFPWSDISILRVYVWHITKTVSIRNWSIGNFFRCKVHVSLTCRMGLKLADSADLFMPRSVVTRHPVHALTFVFNSVNSKLSRIFSRVAGNARDISSWKIKVFDLENGVGAFKHLWFFPFLCHLYHFDNMVEACSTSKFDWETCASSATWSTGHRQVSLKDASFVQKR